MRWPKLLVLLGRSGDCAVINIPPAVPNPTQREFGAQLPCLLDDLDGRPHCECGLSSEKTSCCLLARALLRAEHPLLKERARYAAGCYRSLYNRARRPSRPLCPDHSRLRCVAARCCAELGASTIKECSFLRMNRHRCRRQSSRLMPSSGQPSTSGDLRVVLPNRLRPSNNYSMTSASRQWYCLRGLNFAEDAK